MKKCRIDIDVEGVCDNEEVLYIFFVAIKIEESEKWKKKLKKERRKPNRNHYRDGLPAEGL
jgi:hypothetical protein